MIVVLGQVLDDCCCLRHGLWLVCRTVLANAVHCCMQGIERLGQHSWVLLDGTFLGNNTISNANPYKHWWVAPALPPLRLQSFASAALAHASCCSSPAVRSV